MKIKKFEEYNINESVVLLTGTGIGLLLFYGVMYGFAKIANLFNFITFNKAKKRIKPLFNKIKDDKEISELITKLFEYKDSLSFAEEEGPNPRRQKAYEIRDAIYERALEILSEEEYKTFISSAKEFERGSEKLAGYFANKDSKFKGWDYTV